MERMIPLSGDQLKYLGLLAKQYPTIQSVCTEIINLRAILNLPKGTEHFLSDLHGEYEAFTHILNNCSGVIREKVDQVFGDRLPEWQRAELCTLIYYPQHKLKLMKVQGEDLEAWYETILLQMTDICKVVASKHTRSKVRKAMPADFSYIIDELLHADYEEANQSLYYEKILESILAIGAAEPFICALASLIKRLAVDRLHIVGDIFDRGPRPDLIMDQLMDHHSADIQWGNHDILWMGAACGNPACVAAVVVNSAVYGNVKVLEQGYGISLRPLALFADKTYRESPRFSPRIRPEDDMSQSETVLAGKMYKAIAIIMLKLECGLYRRHPEYGMAHRILLDKIDLDRGTILLDGVEHPLLDRDLPTVDPRDPLALTDEEQLIIEELVGCFRRSNRLRQHIQFLYANGGMYKLYNHNLMYHGCIPMEEDGSFTTLDLCGKAVSGRRLMDQADRVARRAYFGSGAARDQAMDAMWYLWCGRNSPLFGRARMTTFERLFVRDQSTWTEEKNPYYRLSQSPEVCARILEEFGLSQDFSHIINGHVPVRAVDGESPIKGGGRLIVIDGGFCRAYHSQTGIAGYTLIYNSHGMRLSAHRPFESIQEAVVNNVDIHSTSQVFETMVHRMRVADTDIGQSISEQIYDLSLLLSAYRSGLLHPVA